MKFKIFKIEKAAKHNEYPREKSVNGKKPRNNTIARGVKIALTIKYHYLKKNTIIICREMKI